MISIKFKLLFLFVMAGTVVSAQTLQQYQIGVGNSSNVLSGSTSLRYANGELTMGSAVDNNLTFQNPSGIGYFQYDGSGSFLWWTPISGVTSRRMILTNTGKLKIGGGLASGYDYGDAYKLQVEGGAYFANQVRVNKEMNSAAVANAEQYHAARNTYILNGTISNNAYHTAQENVLTAMSGTISGYQTSAQKNIAYLYGQNYTDLGAGAIWSVQTNTFYPDGNSTISKFINTYIRTQLGTGNTIGNYYSLYIESPFGSGSVSQITNYWGLYQENTTAKNYLGGKLGIGTTNVADPNYKLFVETGIRTRKVKVDALTWADFVFHPEYKLRPLDEVESFIKKYQHLPEVPSASEVEKEGVDLGTNQAVLLQKIEELTLYIIEENKKGIAQNKVVQQLTDKLEEQSKVIDQLIKRIEQLEKK